MSQITTHILDTSKGKPAAGVSVALFSGRTKERLGGGKTNADGRITDLLPSEQRLAPGAYKLEFLTGDYFAREQVDSFYPLVEIWFQITDESHYHVPLLLNPFGFSTYRGS